MDLGPPASYLVLAKGVPVFDPDGGEVGLVEHVLAAPEEDIFDGIVIDTAPGPGGWHFADAEQVAEIHERGWCCVSARTRCTSRARTPRRWRPTRRGSGSALGEKLKRAWDYISGNY